MNSIDGYTIAINVTTKMGMSVHWLLPCG